MSLEVERVPLGGHALAVAYAEDRAAVAGFYEPGAPGDLTSYEERARRLASETAPEIWAELSESYAPEDPAAADRFRAVIESRGFFVTTGQQAGLFGGPLMVLYKALAAVRLADELQARTGVPTMALFGVASEDHDWLEINHADVIDLENRLQRIDAPQPGDGGGDLPIHRLLVGDDVRVALSALRDAIPESEGAGLALGRVAEAYRPGSTYSAAFADLLRNALAGYPILVTEMSDRHTKAASRDVLWTDWSRREESSRRLRERAEAIAAAGFDPQVQVPEGATNLFVEGELGRDRVLWEGETAVLRRSRERLSPEDLRGRIEDGRGSVSPGVLLRPVATSRAFPVIAQIVGPAEIAYLAQAQVLFDLHAAVPPIIVPRGAFRIVEPKIRRVLDKYGLEPEALAGDPDQVVSRLVKQSAPAELREALEALSAAAAAALAEVERAALAFDAGAASALGSGRSAVEGGIDTLRRKLEARVKEKNGVMRQQLEKAAVSLYPSGVPQERILNATPFLARYGSELLQKVYDLSTLHLT